MKRKPLKILEETETYRIVLAKNGDKIKRYRKSCSNCGKNVFVPKHNIDRERNLCMDCTHLSHGAKIKGRKFTEDQKEKMRVGLIKAHKEGKFVHLIKPNGLASFDATYNSYVKEAKDRNLEWMIDEIIFRSLTSQNCYYCGKPPSQIRCKNSRMNGNYYYNGLDRVDNDKGYILENIVTCCKECNYAKRKMSKKDFLAMVKRIYELQVKMGEITMENQPDSKNPLTPTPAYATIHPMNDKTIEEKRNERRKLTGECFTPSYLVSEICDKLVKYSPESFTNTGLLFLDPSCGDGNILLQVLKRKLKYATPLQAISTIFGCDIMIDNVQECRLRLLKLLQENNIKLTIEHIKILKRNIVCAPLNKYPNGSLDYLDLDEKDTFNDKMTDDQAKNALTKIIEGNKLSEVSIEEDPIPQPKINKPIKPMKSIEAKEIKKNHKESKLELSMQGSIFDQFDDDPDFK